MSSNPLSASILALSAVLSFPACAQPVTVKSPDDRNVITLDSDRLTYSVSRDGMPIITDSPLGLVLDSIQLGAGARLAGETRSSINDTYRIVVGKAAAVPDRYNQSELAFIAGDKAFKFNVVVRAYDNGVAFRYAVPVQPGVTAVKVMTESTEFRFARDYDCWGSSMNRLDPSFEAEFDRMKASTIHNSHNLMAPLVCKTGRGQTTFAIAESDVKDYPGFFLSGRGVGGVGVTVTLSPRFDNDRSLRFRSVVAANVPLTGEGMKTPWRVVMLGDTPGALAASALIPTLATRSQIEDTSWITPAKTSWDWWNDWDIKVPAAGVNTATYKAFIDFSKEMKLEGILIDEGWSIGSDVEPRPDADVTRAKPAIDMPELLDYARSQGIGIWLWLQWEQLDRQMDAALSQYQKWGIKGIKVDFMNRNDQEMVDWYHKLLEKAAAHHIMVDLHGAMPPNGLSRTWPNLITQEAVLGAEANKGSARITATHDVTLPFTRMILGPMDYTPGGFRHALPAGFRPRSHAPMVQHTRGHAIAMYVVYDSPLQMVSDAPAAYKSSDGKTWADGAEFIQTVPSSWDETRVLAGDIGQFIVSARRKGDTWYIGAMTNEQARTVKVPLDFLGKGAYSARVMQDGADISRLTVSGHKVLPNQSLTLKLAPSGGAVVILRRPAL
jgi:alpha-glucosidase